MIVLREAHERARRDPAFVEPDPRAELALLADAFPGALREIDRLAMDVIRSRIEQLALAEGDVDKSERWMDVQALFHRLARGALATKRWLAGRRVVTEEDRELFRVARATLGADLMTFDLADVARPPRGRLMLLVRSEVARRLGLTEREVDQLLR
jgi:hypothetical protein